MLILIDNYDSFTYNLYQYLGILGQKTQVFKNDAIKVEEIEALKPSHIIISPGPCSPTEAGISLEVVDYFKNKVPILGVCLGHQTIGHYFGGKVVRANEVYHGKVSAIEHDGKGIFENLPTPLNAIRYHSLIIAGNSLPNCLEVSAQTENGEIMGVRHKDFPIEGVQFHPESILSEYGMEMVANFLKIY